MAIRRSAIALILLLSTAICSHGAEIKPLTQELKDSQTGKWLSAWGDYSFNLGASSLETGTSYSNQLNLGVRGTPAKILTLDMSMTYLHSNKFGDTSLYAPGDDYLRMHRAYATLELLDKRLRISGGRRPFGESLPLSSLQNKDQIDDRANSSLLSNFHFDGGVISYAPENLSFLGSYWQIMYGHGYGSDSLSTQPPSLTSMNSPSDSDIFGISLVPVNIDWLRAWLQWSRVFEIKDFPVMNNTLFGNTAPSTALGDIDWFSIGAKASIKNLGGGDLNFFVDGSMSVSRPNGNVSSTALFQGLLTGGAFSPESSKERTGYAVITGIRYDLPTKTKIGFEYNYGSKYWIVSNTTVTGKSGTRGNVYEPFIMQEIDLKPVTSIFTKTFVRIGFQYYDFEYTGSSNWIGAPIKISDITSGMMLLQTPVNHSRIVYGAFEVHF